MIGFLTLYMFSLNCIYIFWKPIKQRMKGVELKITGIQLEMKGIELKMKGTKLETKKAELKRNTVLKRFSYGFDTVFIRFFPKWHFGFPASGKKPYENRFKTVSKPLIWSTSIEFLSFQLNSVPFHWLPLVFNLILFISIKFLSFSIQDHSIPPIFHQFFINFFQFHPLTKKKLRKNWKPIFSQFFPIIDEKLAKIGFINFKNW